MRQIVILTLLLSVTNLALTPTPPADAMQQPILPACPLDGGTGLTFHKPTVDEMVSPGSTVLTGYDNLKGSLLAGLKAVYPDVAGVELLAPDDDGVTCWAVLARDGLGNILWAKDGDGAWMDWANYPTLNPDETYSFAAEVNGEPIAYAPVHGSAHATLIFEGDRKVGNVLPVLVKQPVPITDKGTVHSMYADMTKAETEWKQVEGLGKVATLPDREKTLESAITNGWWWANVDGKEKWVQDIVRNEKGEIPLEDGITVKLKEITHIQSGKVDFTEKDGTNPFPKDNVVLANLPPGYEWTELIFVGFNTPNNSMRPYGPIGTIGTWLVSGSTDKVTPSIYQRSVPNEPYARFILFVPHKIGDEVGGLRMSKLPGGPLHSVYSIKDPFTLELQP
jgi:hypothetical protein